jgi:UDP-4-amino-4,6-dideoxy-N-acetyl-beta-L-altrosamine N-acetyltransferase
VIVGERVNLRQIEEEDLERLKEWRNDPELKRAHFSFFPLSMAEQRRWFERLLGDNTNKVFIVETKDGVPIGYTLMKDIDWKNQRAEIGIHLDKNYHGMGYGTDAFKALIKFAFDEMNLHRLYSYVHSWNRPSIRMCEKSGMKVEGTLRDHFFGEGRFQDVVLLAIIKER